jgi:hypothetical protein
LPLFDNIDLQVTLVMLISVPIVIMVTDSLAVVFLVGLILVPQPVLWTRAFDHRRPARRMMAYVVANEIVIAAIACCVVFFKLRG